MTVSGLLWDPLYWQDGVFLVNGGPDAYIQGMDICIIVCSPSAMSVKGKTNW